MYTISRNTFQGNSRYGVIIVDFPALFRSLLIRQDITQAELARRANDNQSHLNAALNGKAKPALPRVHRWADALVLDDTTRRLFILAAIRCHVPDTLASVVDEIAGSISIAAGMNRAADNVVEYGDSRRAMLIPYAGRAAAAQGAHVDGETADEDPLPIRPHWRAHLIAGDSGLPIVYPGQTVLTDPRLKPKKNRIVVLPTRDGPVLKRWGEIEGDGVIVASLNGMDPTHYHLADHGQAEVVVAVVFTDSVAK
jgi:transcriptional regulator with XRE-family HTH domain